MSTTPSHPRQPNAPAGDGPLIVIIDGLSFLFRAFHAVRHTLTRSDGMPVNALFGFSQMLQKVIEDLQPQYCVVALDSKGPTFRHDMYLEYKANRPEPDPAIIAQIPQMPNLINSFGVAHFQCEGCEADDIIASIVLKSKEKFDNPRVAIVSSDKDLNALIGGNIKLWDTMKDKWLGPNEVHEKFGVFPEKIPEILALMGDASDNVPGVPGIGPKTAAGLIQDFENIDELYKRVDEVKNERIRNLLKEHEKDAHLSRRLVQLKDDVSLPDFQAFEFKPDLAHAIKYLREQMEFHTLAARLEKRLLKGSGSGSQMSVSGPAVSVSVPETRLNDAQLSTNGSPQQKWGPYECVTTPDAWQKMLAAVRAAGVVAFDTETTSLNPYAAKLVGISLAVPGGHDGHAACYVPLNHVDPDSAGGGDGSGLFDAGAKRPEQLPYQDVLKDLLAILADPAIKKIAHNLKYDWLVVAHAAGVTPKDTGEKLQGLFVNIEDTMLLSACLDGGRWQHGLDDLTARHLDHAMIKYEDVCGKGKAQVTFDRVALDKATEYAAEDADATLRLWQALSPRLSEFKRDDFGPAHVYTNIEMKLLPVIIAMEARGVRVDVPALRGLADQFAKRLAELEQSIFKTTGHEFNVASPAQLGVVLFDELKLGTPAQQKKRGTGVDILGELLEYEVSVAGPAIGLIQGVMEYRTISKLRGTYAETLPEEVSPLTHRIHTSYQQIGAGTGRFSSTEPNLQNIPIRTAEGRKIRQAFIPRQGWKMLSADYAQIELRLLAHFSGSPGLIEAFERGDDIHAATAASIFGVALKDVSKDQRRAAKVVNFGLVYGMGANSLAAQANVSRHEAAEWMAAYFQRYDGVREYMDSNKQKARASGYVETLCGRRVHLPGITNPNGGIRSNSERAAINAPLQGSNADVIKLAMPQVEKLLNSLGAQLLMQVHDELVLEASPDVVDELKRKLPEVMCNVVKLRVPLTVEVGVGANWDEAH